MRSRSRSRSRTVSEGALAGLVPAAAITSARGNDSDASAWSDPHRRVASLNQVRASFHEAASLGAAVAERCFALGGHRVTLRSANSRMLVALTRGLEHVATARPPRVDLVVNLWDTASCGTNPPPVPPTAGETAPGAFFYYGDELLRVGYELGTSGDARVHGVYPNAPTPSLSVLDAVTDEAWYWVEDSTRIPYWEQATPLKYILDWWLRDRGVQPLHAGAVGTAEGGVLLVGKSGSGKSTSTLSALESRLQYAGDDYVGVGLDPEPWVHCLYSSGKLMPDHVQRLPFLLPAIANSGQVGVEKAVVYVHEHWPQRICSGFPLRAILVPTVCAGLRTTRTQPLSRLDGLRALAPSTVFQMHTRGRDSLARMARLVERLPCFQLQLGSDVSTVPIAIEGLLEQLNRGE